MAGSIKIPLHIKPENRTKSDYEQIAVLHAEMAQLNPSGFRKFSTKLAKKDKNMPLAEKYSRLAGLI